MAKVRGMLSDAQVRDVKLKLMEGHTVAEVARFYQQSADTIGRIKRGVSRQSVVVAGEAMLRGPSTLMERVDGPAGPRGIAQMLDDEADALLEKLKAAPEGEVEEGWNGGVGKYEEALEKMKELKESRVEVEAREQAEEHARVMVGVAKMAAETERKEVEALSEELAARARLLAGE